MLRRLFRRNPKPRKKIIVGDVMINEIPTPIIEIPKPEPEPETPKLWNGKARVKRREKNSGKVRYYAEKLDTVRKSGFMPQPRWNLIQDTTDNAHLHKDIGDAVAVADAYFKKLVKSDEVVME